MFNPDDEQDSQVQAELPSAATQLNLPPRTYLVRNHEEVGKALAAIEGNDDAGFYISGSPVLNINRAVIAERMLAMKRPAIGGVREQTVAGLLASYGASITDNYRKAADFVVKIILRGERPGDLPIEQAVRFDLIINLKKRQGARPRRPADAARRRRRGDRVMSRVGAKRTGRLSRMNSPLWATANFRHAWARPLPSETPTRHVLI